MSGTKKLPKYVTVQQHRAALIAMHQGTVAAVLVEMKGLEDRLRAELGPQPCLPDGSRGTTGATYEGNHLAPTPAEGAE